MELLMVNLGIHIWQVQQDDLGPQPWDASFYFVAVVLYLTTHEITSFTHAYVPEYHLYNDLEMIKINHVWMTI